MEGCARDRWTNGSLNCVACDADLRLGSLVAIAAPKEECVSRILRVGGAQMGPVQKTESRQAVVRRMVDLLEQAKAHGCNLVVYPELALTTFFPRWYMTDPIKIDSWFEREIPNPATRPLFETAAQCRIGISFGYAELTADGHHFNTAILVDPDGRIVGKYRKVHLPGHAEYDPARTFQHLEKRYFEPGDLGFPVWRAMGGIVGMCICNDRRWPETYRVMGLQGVELIVLGYNTPSTNSQRSEEGPQKRQFHNRLTVQAGAYQNSAWLVAVAKSGTEDGHHLIAGSMIVNPDGEIVSEAKTEDDELIVADCDLDATTFGKQTVFDFARHRRIEHYGRITSQTGIVLPPE
jgi:predicted amidohydrolase